MKKAIKITLTVTALPFIMGFVYLDPYNIRYSQHWTCNHVQTNDTLPWFSFTWEGYSDHGKTRERSAMLLPVRIDGVAANFYCQFDIGAVFSVLYAPFNVYIDNVGTLHSKVSRHLGTKCLENITIETGCMKLHCDRLKLRNVYANDTIPVSEMYSNDRKLIGTIGVDVCQDKVLIIDYPNARLCIIDSVPACYSGRMYDMKQTGAGRAILRMEHKGKEYDLFYDTGSSIAPLWVSKSMVADFTAAPVDDTIVANSWGKPMYIYGRPMKDTVFIAGKPFSDFELLSNNKFASRFMASLAVRALGFSGLIGNALFLNSTVILDFKHKKFAVL